MDLEQLKDEIQASKQKLEKQSIDRNYVQLERDTIQTFYDITKKERSDFKAAVQAKDRDMEQLEDNHRIEVRIYIQKLSRAAAGATFCDSMCVRLSFAYTHETLVNPSSAPYEALCKQPIMGKSTVNFPSVKLVNVAKAFRSSTVSTIR